LERVEERIQVDGVPISREELAARMAEVAAAVRQLEAGPYPPPTFFEIGTALGFWHFVCRRADVAILEVGLGGRFDSTNVCRPLASVITSVGLDHTAQLGNTREEIAYQKAGIIKPRVPVVSGVMDDGPRRVIEREAAQQSAPLRTLGRDFRYAYRLEGTASVATIRTERAAYTARLGLPGEHQAANAALAVATVETLRDAGLIVPDAAVERGLADVYWPARIEVISTRPTIILDSAHNVPSAEALVATLRASFPTAGRKSVVFAVSSDKQYADILRILAGYFDQFHLTRYGHNPRCVPPENLATILAVLAPEKSISVYRAAPEAWRAARSATGPDDVICVTGSMFLAGELTPLVRG
jgi:dihydrofolate synthase/folylpolyglutamate synthase